MNIHQNARLTLKGRARLVRLVVEDGMSLKTASRACGVSPGTGAKWVARFRAEGPGGLLDRSSRPRRLRKPTPQVTIDRVIALRRQRWTGAHIAAETGVSPATVSRILRRAGLSRLKDLEPAQPARRYEHDAPGDMIHIDIKKLGRFERVGHRITGDRRGQSTPRSSTANAKTGYGWEHVHVAIDDHSRLAFTQIHPPEGRHRLVQAPWHHRETRHDRQWQLLCLKGLRKGLPQARPETCPNQTLHPAHQWQG